MENAITEEVGALLQAYASTSEAYYRTCVYREHRASQMNAAEKSLARKLAPIARKLRARLYRIVRARGQRSWAVEALRVEGMCDHEAHYCSPVIFIDLSFCASTAVRGTLHLEGGIDDADALFVEVARLVGYWGADG